MIDTANTKLMNEARYEVCDTPKVTYCRQRYDAAIQAAIVLLELANAQEATAR